MQTYYIQFGLFAILLPFNCPNYFYSFIASAVNFLRNKFRITCRLRIGKMDENKFRHFTMCDVKNMECVYVCVCGCNRSVHDTFEIAREPNDRKKSSASFWAWKLCAQFLNVRLLQYNIFYTSSLWKAEHCAVTCCDARTRSLSLPLLLSLMYVHQTEHNTIKLLFIFVLVSFHHTISFSSPPPTIPGEVFSRSFGSAPFSLLFICFKVALLFYLRNNTSKLH